LPLALITLDDVAPVPDVVEDGATFEENATKKALVLARVTGKLVLGDDSGLEVDALSGRPGVWSARFAGQGVTDTENNQKLVAELRALQTSPPFHARYRVVLAFADVDGPLGEQAHLEHGVCEGRIRLQPAGQNGFGYDPYFVPDGFDCTMAELSAEQKNQISHRAQAALAMRRFLAEYVRAL
jgi:XTP/dITP diphosphohydrolase